VGQEADMRRILVTGVSRPPGPALARRLAGEPEVARVIGVDVTQPREELPGVEFVRADIRSPVAASLLDSEQVETIVHLGGLSGPAGRGAGREVAVIGTLQLLAAARRATSLRAFVLESSTAVYGAGPNDAALATEDTPLPAGASGRARDAAEIEKYVDGLAQRRSGLRVCLLRLASLAGPTVRTPLARYLRRTVVPTMLGYDPRLQLLHEDDAVDALLQATLGEAVGTYNVAGEGALYLSQAARRLGRPQLPVPAAMLPWFLGRVDPPLWLLRYGRVVDTSRIKKELGFAARYTTAEALQALGERR
jgi:UDP-glucose 4-epimerase